jgi:hypothetical protein
MKKQFLLVVLVFISLSLAAQEVLVNKRGREILPQQGDIAIGILANPFLDFAGNLFNGTQNNRFELGLLNGNAIYGKYFFSSQSAFRLKTQIAVYKLKSKETSALIRNREIEMSVGYEWRRGGASRFQFFYGPEVIFGSNWQETKIDYWNHESEGFNYIGLRGFLGAEYFFMPKLSLAAEMGIGFKQSVKGNHNFISMGSDIMGGQIVLLIHF